MKLNLLPWNPPVRGFLREEAVGEGWQEQKEHKEHTCIGLHIRSCQWTALTNTEYIFFQPPHPPPTPDFLSFNNIYEFPSLLQGKNIWIVKFLHFYRHLNIQFWCSRPRKVGSGSGYQSRTGLKHARLLTELLAGLTKHLWVIFTCMAG